MEKRFITKNVLLSNETGVNYLNFKKNNKQNV